MTKSVQAAGRLLALAGGQMTLARLGTLMYVVDRHALGRWGRPVAFESYVVTPRGMEPSIGFERLFDGSSGQSGWDHIELTRGGQRVRLESALGYDGLSEAEEDLISELHLECGRAPTSELQSMVTAFPEVNELPAGSSSDITVHDILLAQGYSTQEAMEVAAELEVRATAESLAH